MGRYIKVFFEAIILLLIINPIYAKAGVYDNAYTYYQNYGSDSSTPARLNASDGYIYFCSAGLASTTNTRYKTVGYKITIHVGTQTDSVEVKLGGTYVRNVSEVTKDGYTYVLRKVGFNRLKTLFNGNNDISWNRIYRSRNTYSFDAIMTVVEKGKQLCGNVSETSGYRQIRADNNKYLFRTARSIKSARNWNNPSDLDSFFNKYVSFDPVDNIRISSFDLEDSDNVYKYGDKYYVRKDSWINVASSSYMLDAIASCMVYHPNYNMINVSGWGKNQKYYMAQSKTAAKCESGMLSETGDASKPLTLVGTVVKGTTGSDDSMTCFNSCSRYLYSVSNENVIYLTPEARIYYDGIYPASESDKDYLCDRFVDDNKRICLLSDSEKPLIQVGDTISAFGYCNIPFSVADNGSGIRKIEVYLSDGSKVIEKVYNSGKVNYVVSGNDFRVNINKNSSYYILVTDNVGNIAKSADIKYVVPNAHKIETTIIRGPSGYNCRNVTTYVYGGNSEIASFVIMSEDDGNPTGNRIVLVNNDVSAGTLESGLYRYTHSFDPMNALGRTRDGIYHFDVISGGRYVSSEPGQFIIYYDKTPPTIDVSMLSSGLNGWYRSKVSFLVKASDKYSGINCACVSSNIGEVTGKTKQEYIGGPMEGTYNVSGDGIHYVLINVKDIACNGWTVHKTFKIDSVGAEYTLPDILSGTEVNQNIWINKDALNQTVIINDKLSGFGNNSDYITASITTNGYTRRLKLNQDYTIYFEDDKTAHFKLTNSYINSLLSNRYKLMIEGQDLAGNNNSTRMNINLDLEGPLIDYNIVDGWDSKTWTGNVNVSDTMSGVKAIELICDGDVVDSYYYDSEASCNVSIDLSDCRNNSHVICVKAEDKVGNTSYCTLPVEVYDKQDTVRMLLRTRIRR